MAKPTHQEIAKLRADIEQCRDEINWLIEAPITKGELKSRAKECCKTLADKFDAPRHMGSLANPSAGLFEMQAMFRTSARVFIPGKLDVTSADSEDVGPMLAWVMGETLVQRMHADIDCLDYRPGPPMAERPARLGELRATLRKLEQQEEALISRGEETGVFIPRRDDADPAVILAYDPDGKSLDAKIMRTAKAQVALAGATSVPVMANEESLPEPSSSAEPFL